MVETDWMVEMVETDWMVEHGGKLTEWWNMVETDWMVENDYRIRF